MFVLARIFFIGFIVLTVVYVCLSFYARAVRRDRLEAEWDAAQGPGERAEFVEDGMDAYQHSLRRKLLLGVYIVPLLLVCLIVYLTNYA